MMAVDGRWGLDRVVTKIVEEESIRLVRRSKALRKCVSSVIFTCYETFRMLDMVNNSLHCYGII